MKFFNSKLGLSETSKTTSGISLPGDAETDFCTEQIRTGEMQRDLSLSDITRPSSTEVHWGNGLQPVEAGLS